jgi:uncharacterized protein (TIGR03067 family)
MTVFRDITFLAAGPASESCHSAALQLLLGGRLMKRYLASVIMATLTLTMASADDNDAEKEVKKLQGTWKLVKFETPPDKQPPEGTIEKMRIVFADNKLIIRVGDEVVDETTFKLDRTKSPKWFDTISTVGPNKGKTAEGIYEIKGDDLKICIGPPGQKRPTEFKVIAESDTKTGVMFLKRQKP